MDAQFLSLLVGKLLDYTAVPVGRQFSYLFCYNGNLEEFRNQLRGLEMAGRDVKLLVEAAARNGEEILPSVADWLKRVDSVSEKSKRFVEEEDAISKCCFNGPLNLKVRYQRSRKAKKKAAEFDAIKKDARFDQVSRPAPPLPIWSAINENEYDFESRRSIFNEIMEAIEDDGVGMIGIWGMPGIGKTTLVKRVARYAKDEGRFNNVAMAVVSKDPNVKAIQGQIAYEIGLKLTPESNTGRAGQLLQCLLARKKILIVLDDIWDRIELDDIGIPSASQHKGCKIILTTRKRGVCEEMGTWKNFTIDLLTANEALDLFLRKSGVDDQFSEKGRLAKTLSEECGRLPISIVIIARGLVNKPKGSWEDMVTRLHNSDPEEKVLDIIKLSYDNLHREEEQMFFLLCALFPEDYKIPIQVLFEYGLGLNLFAKINNVDQAAVRAQNLASRLKSQCLLLDEGDENFVKMHDVIRDAALVIASKGKHAFLVQSEPRWREWSKKTAISMWSDDVKKLPDALECPQLQILMLTCCYDVQIHDNFFAGMKNLFVLHMFNMEFTRLPQSFAALENLQTLRLDGCRLRDISAIGKLQNLVSLSFYNSRIKVLPKEVGELSNLRFLNLSWCEAITPGVIQNLSQLEVLHLPYNVGTTILLELNYLQRLIILEICMPDASVLPDDDVLFRNLMKFQVSIGEFPHERMNIFSSSSQILKLGRVSNDELSKPGIKMLMKKAHHMKLENISGTYVALSSPLGGYGSLEELIVQSCEDVNYVVDVSSECEPETPSLHRLVLMNLPSLKEISRGKFLSFLFSKLEHLKLFGLPRLVRLWSFQVESNLTTMEVSFCDKLEYVFDHDSAKGLSKLKQLEVCCCRNLEAICLSKEQGEDIVFPQLSELKLSDLENLASFSSKSTLESTLFDEKVSFPILKSMRIAGLENFKKIWHDNISSKWFSHLQQLNVSDCDQLVEVFPCHLDPNLNCLEQVRIEKCRLLRGKSALKCIAALPKLKNLELDLYQQPIEWKDSFNRYGGFQNLASLNFSNCNDLKSLSTLLTIRVIAQLRKLSVSNCESIESIIGEENFEKSIEFSKLKTLKLDTLPRLASFYDGASCGLKFPCLDKLWIKSCYELKTFASVSRETPEPSYPNFVSEKELFGQQVSFGRLSDLRLEGLESIEEIWHRDHPATTVGELGYLTVKGCDRLSKIFPSNLIGSLQNLLELEVRSCQSLEHVFAAEEIWHRDHPATMVGELRSLTVEGCNRLSKLFPSNLIGSLQNLQQFEIRSCRSLEHVFAAEDHPPLLSNLQRLELQNLDKLKQLWWNKNSSLSFGLPRLYRLTIDTCPGLEFIFDPSVGSCLENLTFLSVENCYSMVEIVAEKPGKKVEFPLLRMLELGRLPFFRVKQDVEFPQAETVFLDGCFSTRNSFTVYVINELAKPVRYFESFEEFTKTEPESSP